MSLRVAPLLLVLSVASTVDAEVRHAGAHVHGVHQLQMVQDGSLLSATYTMPAGQLEEVTPASDHKHDAHHHDDHDHGHSEGDSLIGQEGLESFRTYRTLFDAEAIQQHCTLTDYQFELRAVVADQDDPHAGHKDAILEYQFNCGDAFALKTIVINAFKAFDDLETVYFEALLAGEGLSMSLTSAEYRVEL